MKFKELVKVINTAENLKILNSKTSAVYFDENNPYEPQSKIECEKMLELEVASIETDNHQILVFLKEVEKWKWGT